MSVRILGKDRLPKLIVLRNSKSRDFYLHDNSFLLECATKFGKFLSHKFPYSKGILSVVQRLALRNLLGNVQSVSVS